MDPAAFYVIALPHVLLINSFPQESLYGILLHLKSFILPDIPPEVSVLYLVRKDLSSAGMFYSNMVSAEPIYLEAICVHWKKQSKISYINCLPIWLYTPGMVIKQPL